MVSQTAESSRALSLASRVRARRVCWDVRRLVQADDSGSRCQFVADRYAPLLAARQSALEHRADDAVGDVRQAEAVDQRRHLVLELVRREGQAQLRRDAKGLADRQLADQMVLDRRGSGTVEKHKPAYEQTK